MHQTRDPVTTVTSISIPRRNFLLLLLPLFPRDEPALPLAHRGPRQLLAAVVAPRLFAVVVAPPTGQTRPTLPLTLRIADRAGLRVNYVGCSGCRGGLALHPRATGTRPAPSRVEVEGLQPEQLRGQGSEHQTARRQAGV